MKRIAGEAFNLYCWLFINKNRPCDGSLSIPLSNFVYFSKQPSSYSNRFYTPTDQNPPFLLFALHLITNALVFLSFHSSFSSTDIPQSLTSFDLTSQFPLISTQSVLAPTVSTTLESLDPLAAVHWSTTPTATILTPTTCSPLGVILHMPQSPRRLPLQHSDVSLPEAQFSSARNSTRHSPCNKDMRHGRCISSGRRPPGWEKWWWWWWRGEEGVSCSLV